MERTNLKVLFKRLRDLVDELESEIYSDPQAYIKPDIETTIGSYESSEDDDGYPD